jgi:two-component system sensor histidine kinase PilS (NtrC family)
MKEEIVDPAQARLISIIGDNVGRLNRMIEDILKLSRKAQTRNDPLKLGSFLEELIEEFVEAQALPPTMIYLGGIGTHRIWFDPLHLREVIVNLLSNAMRYASKQDWSIRIYAIANSVNRIELHVQDDGVPITPEVRAHLFEPFYTTSSKGTGLGLYLARELCLNNGAMIDYEYCMDALNDQGNQIRGRFVITMANAQSGNLA